ncbi:MAG: tRNA pseudouridine synthase A [Gemmatimonadota bacterium]|nr:tRNA pseudouridine synthase A [Gemmatimonadota bacterium]
MSRTYLALLHYDGRAFAGWQRQPEVRTVQGEVERVLERLCGSRIVANAAGRTDAGVHAAGMGVSLEMPERWEAEALHRALNGLLPADCWVERVSEMAPGFHARWRATGRRYRYEVGTDPASASPFRRGFEWALGRELDGGRLVEAAAVLPGRHSFEAFSVRQEKAPVIDGGGGAQIHPCGIRTRPYALGPYECTIGLARWEIRPEGQGFRFHVAADRFLHHMVRFLVGTMVEIGLGRRPVEDMVTLLRTTDNCGTSQPAPAEGLYFQAASYPEECYLQTAEAVSDGR